MHTRATYLKEDDTMWKDPIVEEVRRTGAKIAKECDYDLHKMIVRLKQREQKMKKSHGVVSIS